MPIDTSTDKNLLGYLDDQKYTGADNTIGNLFGSFFTGYMQGKKAKKEMELADTKNKVGENLNLTNKLLEQAGVIPEGVMPQAEITPKPDRIERMARIFMGDKIHADDVMTKYRDGQLEGQQLKNRGMAATVKNAENAANNLVSLGEQAGAITDFSDPKQYGSFLGFGMKSGLSKDPAFLKTLDRFSDEAKYAHEFEKQKRSSKAIAERLTNSNEFRAAEAEKQRNAASQRASDSNANREKVKQLELDARAAEAEKQRQLKSSNPKTMTPIDMIKLTEAISKATALSEDTTKTQAERDQAYRTLRNLKELQRGGGTRSTEASKVFQWNPETGKLE